MPWPAHHRHSLPADAAAPAQRGAKIAVLALLDRQPMLRCGLKVCVATDPGLFWLDTLGTTEATRISSLEMAPDVVLIDADTASREDLAALDTLLAAKPFPRLLVLKGLASEQGPHFSRLASRAACVLDKSASPQELVTAIQTAYQRSPMAQAWQPDAGGAHAGARSGLRGHLTPRECDLLKLLVQGLSNQKIAGQMGITVTTVKFHVTHILSKLQAENRTQAVLLALRHGLAEDQ